MKDTKKLIEELYKITNGLKEIHPHRNFTPDGILVGSIGEVLAEYHYGLTPLPPGEKQHDCRKGNKLIQIKTTQNKAIQIGEPCVHLIALKLLRDGTVTEFYNGPGKPVWDRVKDKNLPKNGLYSVSLGVLSAMMDNVQENEKIERVEP
ncbi:DUF6998 domain-containing protein [Microbulbifer sp. JTAC008]|uniref:DUF6998 domain-containing protein n=1 Tax=unclassified Microbulbifer TaxID=2619833 RepID=UPI00403A339D